MTADPPRQSKKTIVLVGLMGAGKTSVGRRLADMLALDFIDADEEITKAAGCSIEDIFEDYGEKAFRCFGSRMSAVQIRPPRPFISVSYATGRETAKTDVWLFVWPFGPRATGSSYTSARCRGFKPFRPDQPLSVT